MRTVLITGARAPVALDLARSFAAAGYEPHLADSVTPWAARMSRIAGRNIHRLPAPRFRFSAFRTALHDLIGAIDPVLVVPTCEEVFYVAAAMQGSAYSDLVFAPPLGLLRQLHSKHDFIALAKSLGIAVPDTRRIASRAEFDALSWPLEETVLKPEFSRFATAALIRPAPSDVRRLDFDTACWVAQRFVRGREVSLWTAARNGEIVASACYEPAWRVRKSASYAFASIEHEGSLDAARRIVKALRLTGQVSFDIIIRADGTAVPIECNPRAVSGVHLFDGDSALASALLGQGHFAVAAGRLRYLAPAMLLLGLPAAVRSRDWARFKAGWQLGSDVLGRRSDRAPVFGALLDALRFAARGALRGRSASGATTDDIEWNGEPIG